MGKAIVFPLYPKRGISGGKEKRNEPAPKTIKGWLDISDSGSSFDCDHELLADDQRISYFAENRFQREYAVGRAAFLQL